MYGLKPVPFKLKPVPFKLKPVPFKLTYSNWPVITKCLGCRNLHVLAIYYMSQECYSAGRVLICGPWKDFKHGS